MRINNNFNVLPFYDSLQKQNSKKWYSFGQHYPLICPNNTILPFQFITDSEVTVSSNIEAVNVHSGKVTNLGVKPSVSKGTRADATYYIVKMVETTISAMPEGLHYLRINTNKGYLYSEEFTYNVNHEECIKIEYWNENTLNFNSGEINFDDDFRFILYIPSTIGKPEYEFEEELTKRLGYKFIESQTSNKIYKFNFLAPEYICDAMRLIRLCDYIKLTTKFDTFNALSFAYEPKWQDNGDLAAVDVEFDTDCIIQKLESFNRRLKESFYNALLADIDEPVLFSNDIVAQYYTEFTTTSYINGKLIRQLEAINEADLGSLENLVLPIDNQADTEQKAKKITLASLKNVLIKLADYVTLSTAQNINGEKNFIGGLKVNGSPIIYDSVNKCWKLQGNLVLTGGITMYADDGTLNLPSIYDGLPIDGTTIYWDTDAAGNRVLKAVGGGGTADSVAWNNITGKPSWIGSSKPTYSYSEIQNTPDLSQYALQTALDTTNTEVAKKWTKDNSKIANWDSAFEWGNHANAGYVKKTYVDETFVNLTGEQTISGKKNFSTGGLFVNGSQIKYDSTKKYWKLEGDLLVTGGITMYGNEGTYTPSTIMDAILYDESTLGINSIGQLYVKYSGSTTLGGLANVGSWADSVAPQDRIMYQAANSSQWVAKNLSDLAVGGVTGDYLPLSGGMINGENNQVPLAIKNTASTLRIGFVRNNEVLGYLGFIEANKPLFYDTDGNGRLLLHEKNYSSYALPLSGGTLTGDLKFQENWGGMSSILRESLFPAHIYRLVWSTNGDVYDHYYNNNYSSSTYTSANLRVKANDGYLTLRFCGDGTFTWNGNKIWHEGNDGSDSGLDADLLDGVQSSGYGQYVDDLSINLNDARNGLRGGKLYNATNAYDSIDASYRGFLEYGSSGYRAQFNSSSSNDLYYRWCEANTWKPWRKVAFEDSNVASATKLQTSRTIWGQSFDGTENVSGVISNTSTIEFDTSSGAPVIGYLWTNTRGMHMDMSGLGTEQQGTNLTLTRYGNVGIGTPNPSQKLHVKNGNITCDGGFVQSYRTNNPNSSGAYMRLTSYYPEGDMTWDAIIASDYYGNHLCTTGGFTHGMYFKSGRYGYDNFIFLDSQGNPVARLSTSSGAGNHHFVGNMLVTGGITMYSDKRKKTILNHVELSLKQIANAPIIEHYYNGDEKKTTHVGSIAQYWASMNDWFCKLDSEGYYTMEIQNAALASAISIARELDRYETKTDKAIKKLKKRICELEEEVERLKAS